MITIDDIRNPKYANADETLIGCEVQFSHLPGQWLPFGAYENDCEVHGREAYTALVLGVAGPIAPYTAPVPPVVDMRQARLALLNAGLLDRVESAILGMAGDAGKSARIEWDYAKTLQREHPLTSAISALLGIDDATLDSLFIAASKL